MKKLLTSLVLLFGVLTFPIVLSAQCNAPQHAPPACEVGSYNSGSNCHGFAYRYLTAEYSIYNPNCGSISGSTKIAIDDCASYGNIVFNSLYTILNPVSNEADADVITYEQNYGTWIVNHSAVKLDAPGLYLSKWEECGPVIKHYKTTVPGVYYQSNPNFRIRYWEYDNAPPPCNAPTLNISGCSSCSCDYNGLFGFSSSSGFSSHSWSVSGGSIAWNLGSSIYVSKPGGGWIGVNLWATDVCGDTQYKYRSYYLPGSCGGGYPYRVIDPTQISVKLPTPPPAVLLEGDDDGRQAVGTYSDDQQAAIAYPLDAESTVALYSLDGKLIHQQEARGTETTLHLDRPLSTGIYLLRIDTPYGGYSDKVFVGR